MRATPPRRRPPPSPDEEVGRLEEVSRPGLLYPYWHQHKTASDRLSQADLALLAPYLA
jgi:hypothetical protein